jgi:hypothetical protein
MRAVANLGERVWRQWDDLRYGTAVIGTVTGSWPRPRWYDGGLWGRPLDTALLDVRFREQFLDAHATVIAEQERAGLDVVLLGLPVDGDGAAVLTLAAVLVLGRRLDGEGGRTIGRGRADPPTPRRTAAPPMGSRRTTDPRSRACRPSRVASWDTWDTTRARHSGCTTG